MAIVSLDRQSKGGIMLCECASVSRAVKRAIFGVVTASAFAVPAWAAAPGADEGALAEVIVSAQFRQENLQDTPFAITAVSGVANSGISLVAFALPIGAFSAQAT